MKRIAKLLVKESMGIGRGPDGTYESVRVVYNNTDPTCEDFALTVEEECWKVGAHILLTPSSSKRDRLRHQLTPDSSISELSKLGKAVAESIDVTMFIGESDDPNWSQAVSEKVRLAAPVRQSLREILDRRNVRWVYFGWPIPGAAKGYGCPIAKFRRIFFNSIRKSFSEETRRLCQYFSIMLRGGDRIEVKAEDGTSLSFSIKGRPILIDDGVISKEDLAREDVGLNIPSGEVFAAPLETTANGTIRFDEASTHGFGKVKGLTLEFRDGKIESYRASGGAKNFSRFLEANTGEKDRIAELGIGCNRGAEYTGGSIIIDEKIFGTLHIAIGSNTGAYHGTNKASSHLDMIKDMKHGSLLVDGKVIMKRGKPTGKV